jgi:hypothetical protein
MAMRRWLLGAAALLSACDLSAPLRVLTEPREVAAVRVSPRDTVVTLGDTVQFSAVVLGRDNQELDEYEVAWAVTNPLIGVSLGNGRFAFVRLGTTDVIARASDRLGSATVTVRAAP